MRWLCLLLLVGCDGVFGLVHVKETDAQIGGRDAAIDAVDAQAPDALDAFVDIGCPQTYTLVNGSKYRFVMLAKSWNVAQADCLDDTPKGNSMHTHLAVAESDADTTTYVVDVAGSQGDVWVGLTDVLSQTSFKWVTDEPIAYPPTSGSPWAAGEPSNQTNEDCVVEHVTGRAFDDVPCQSSFFYVCECDAYTDVPPANY